MQIHSFMKNQTSFFRALDQAAGIGFERQSYLSRIIGHLPWSVDVPAGTIRWTAGDKTISAKVQLLGSHSEVSNTWRWAWAGTPGQFSEHVLLAARAMHDFGQTHEVLELTDEQLDVGRYYNPDTLGLIASAMFDASGF